jgi:DNA segregation ATPase FtsK/SpoIIIE, S-DNA-T family
VAATRKQTARSARRAKRPAEKRGSGKSGSGKSASADRAPGMLRRASTAIFGTIGTVLSERRRDVWGLVLLLLAVLSGLAIYLDAAGPVGGWIVTGARGGFGLVGILLPVMLIAFGALLVMDRPGPEVGRLGVGASLVLLAVLGGAHLVVDLPAPSSGLESLARGGGLAGWVIAAPLDAALSRAGAWSVIVAMGILGVLVSAHLELRAVLSALWRALAGAGTSLRGLLARTDREDGAPVAPAAPAADAVFVDVPLDDEPGGVHETDDAPETPYAVEDRAVVDVWLDEDPEDATTELAVVDVHEASTERLDAVEAAPPVQPLKARKVLPPGEERPYELPPLELLSTGSALGGDPSRTIAAQSKALQETFDQFGIDAKVARSSRGPTVTRFEVEIGPGVKVNKVANLGDDIAYALAAPDVRIVAPIPGKSAIGIEVPNLERDLISLGDVLRSDVALRDEHPLSVALGVDIAGAPTMVDLSKMPHLLVSGSTGSGKSVTLNGMIASVLMRARPDQVRMLLIDPKRVELGVYEGAPHLLAPVVTDPRRAADAVAWCVKEMEQRYELLALLGYRNIDGYNDAYDRGDLADRPGPDGTTIPPKRLPYILLVIDELADLMLVAPRDVEDAICRIAQMARAVGIHMVIATQRPSVDVITGLIKANIPSRLALAVASQVDSRTILDTGGAEKLVGRGDMLFLPASQGKPSRMQGCWVTEEEIAAVVTFCRTQREPVFEEAVAAVVTAGPGTRSNDVHREDEGDAGLVRRAAEQVVSSGLGSTSMLQRKLRVGFARAGRLMDELEEVGCVGPSEGSKAREVMWDEERLRAALESGLI